MSASAAQVVKNWQAAMQSGTTRQKYIDGINAYNGNPMEAAAAAVDDGRYLAGVQRGLAKMTKKLRSASPNSWKANATGPGASNLVTGAQKGLAKVTAAAQTVAAAGAAGQAAARAATGTMEKIAANIRAIQQTHGYQPTV